MPISKVLGLWSDDSLNEDETALLRKPGEDVPVPFGEESGAHIQTLITTFLERDDALGLAAPQIGISRKIIIFRNKGFEERVWTRDEKDYDVLINPRITQTRGELVLGTEGCLSCPDLQVEIDRYPEIKVRAVDIHGKKINKRYTDFLARIVQHEMDHLAGKLIVDYEGSIFYPKKKQRFFEKFFQGKP